MLNIVIKSARCLIPGYNDHDNGELISTEEILCNIEKLENGKERKNFSPAFIYNKLGIETVALSQTTANFVKKYWSMDPRPSSPEIFAASQSTPNTFLYNMLQKVIKKCSDDLMKKDSNFSLSTIIAHIHISTFLPPFFEPELVKIRQSLTIGVKPLQTIILQQGCSGLFSALDLAKNILTSGITSDSNILITADNNMMIHAHQRCIRNATINNVNEWLWAAIFGEGVGAIIVGKTPNYEDKYFRWGLHLDALEQAVVENDWRVTQFYKPEEHYTYIYIKAKEVSETYLINIKKYAARAIEQSGGLDKLFKICLHESNPRLISIVKRELKIPDVLVPSISKKVGTLACVSSFSLLDDIFTTLDNKIEGSSSQLNEQAKVALALIGDACGYIIAGNIVLSVRAY